MATDHAPPAADESLRQRLEQAAEGLVYSSESDYPFEYFFLPAAGEAEQLTLERFAALLGVPGEVPRGERSLDRFLECHLECSDPWDTRAQAIRPRYERLKALLQESLREVRVFRIGEIRIRCYIVGRDERGNLAGLMTTAVET